MRNYKAEKEKQFPGNLAKNLAKKNECVLGFVRLNK